MPDISLPDANASFLMLLRWVHFLAGITWVGLLYFFNLVNVPFMKEIDTATKGKVMPTLMPRALWWFRWASVVTVLAGVIYWERIVSADAHNAGASTGTAMGSFFAIWTITWALCYALLIPGRGLLNDGRMLAVLVAIIARVDTATKGKVVPTLMPRALWWFRWASVVTVLAGVIVSADAHNAGALPLLPGCF
ncbi:MAG: hypothetical protein JOY93_05455 [Acidobacteriales bacterium]|nr:hypothetical protein [Terriglobales bacterium]